MNTILISGTTHPVGNQVHYNVMIWGAEAGKPLQLICPFEGIISGYDKLWKNAKAVCADYFKEPRFEDGAYTQMLDHLISITK